MSEVNEIELLKERLKDAEEGLVVLQEQLFEKNQLVEENEKLYKRAVNLKMRVQELEEELELKNQESERGEQVSILEAKVKELADQNELLELEKMELQDRIAAQGEESLLLQEQRERALGEAEEAKAHAAQVERAMQYLRDKIEESKLEIDDLKEQLDRFQSAHASSQALCQELEELRGSKEELERVHQEKSHLQGEMEKVKQIILHGVKEAQELKARATRLVEERAEILGREQKAQAAYNQTRSELAHVLTCYKQLEAQVKELDGYRSKWQEATAEIAGLKENFHHVEKEQISLQARVRELQEVENVNEKMQALVDSLQDLLGRRQQGGHEEITKLRRDY